MSIAETFRREPPSKRKEELDGQDRKPKSHEMGLQVPRCVHTEVAQEGAVRSTAKRAGSSVSRVGQAQGESGRRRAPDGRSCAHYAVDTAKVLGVPSRGVYQRQECDTPCQGVRREKEELRRPALLGQRVLCLDRR